MNELKFYNAGDCGLLVKLQERIDPNINRELRKVLQAVEQLACRGIKEAIMGYSSLLIEYDPLVISRKELEREVRKKYGSANCPELPPAVIYRIPTCYGGEYGPDLTFVAEHNGLTPKEVIEIHSERDYLIYMLGFSPGFPYLGGIDKRIASPRLEKPRTTTPAGSVAIAGEQTGVYPSPTPGGWRVIGRTPVRLFDPERNPPIILKAGNSIRFIPINEKEFLQIQEAAEAGRYKVKKENSD